MSRGRQLYPPCSGILFLSKRRNIKEKRVFYCWECVCPKHWKQKLCDYCSYGYVMVFTYRLLCNACLAPQISFVMCEPEPKSTTTANLSSDVRNISEAARSTGCRFFPSLKIKISISCTKCLRLLLISHKILLMIRHNSMHFTCWYFSIWPFKLYVVWTDQILFMCLEEGDRKVDTYLLYEEWWVRVERTRE